MKLIQANLDKTIEIKETDRLFYHVEHLRIIPDATRKHPERNTRIQIYDKKDYDRTFGKGGFVEKHGLGAMNDDEVRVVHDPTLYDKEEQERNDAEAKRIADEAKKAIEDEKAAKEAEKEAAQKAEDDKKAAEDKAVEDQKKEDEEIQAGIKAAKVKKAAERRAKAKAVKEAEDEAERQAEEKADPK